MAELPEELIGEILPHLPVKSLKRFRCLSKPLCELIDSPNFIDSHLSKFTQNSKYLRNLIFQDPLKKRFHVCDVNYDDEEDEIISLGKPVSSPLKLAYGHCKGLILLYRGKFKFSLWNPSIKESRNLPECPLAHSNNRIYSLIGSGLSYDDSINDFKAFCIAHVALKFECDFEIEVWIYQLKSNSWRKSENWKFFNLLYMHHFVHRVLPGIGYFTPKDGILYWVCSIFGYKPEIVAFDVRKETYSVLPLPDCSLEWKRLKNISTALHVLDGCLCVSYLSSSPLEAHLFIRKKKDGAAWTHLFFVTEPLFTDRIWFKCLNVLGYAKGSNKIVLDLGVDCLVSYDIKEKSFAKVEIDKDPNWKCPIPFLESLVSVGGGA